MTVSGERVAAGKVLCVSKYEIGCAGSTREFSMRPWKRKKKGLGLTRGCAENRIETQVSFGVTRGGQGRVPQSKK